VTIKNPMFGVKSPSSGIRLFDFKADAIAFRDEVLSQYPPVAYGTTAIIIDPEEPDGSWVVEYYIYSAD